MGRTTTKQNLIIEMLVKAFIKVRYEGQSDTNTLNRKGSGDKTQPLAVLIDTETQCSELETALNAAIASDPAYKAGEVSIKHLGGSVIPVFLLTFKEVNLVFRLLPDGPYMASYKDLQNGATGKHLPKQHLIIDLKYRAKTYHLELIDYCEKGSLEIQARNHSELIKNKQQLLYNYSINILQIMVDFIEAGIVFPDIKPSNFLIANDGHVVISDVKTLLDIRDKLSVPKIDVMNTPIYESGSGLIRASVGLAKNGASSSIYSKTISITEIELKSRYMVGITLYELATGHMVAIDLAEKQKTALTARDEAKHNYNQLQKAGAAVDLAKAKTEYDIKEADFRAIENKRPHSEMNFELDVFKKGVGLALKTIIQSLTNEDRSSRMTFKTALEQLSRLREPSLSLKSRKNSDDVPYQSASPIATSSTSTDEELATVSSPRVSTEELQSPRVKKRGIVRKERTASASVVVDKKRKSPSKGDLTPEPSQQPSTVQESSSKKKLRFDPKLEAVTEEGPSSPRVKKETDNPEEKKRKIFQRNRTISSPAVVDGKIKNTAETKPSEGLQRFSLFQESLPSPRKSSKGARLQSPRIAAASSSTDEEVVDKASPSIGEELKLTRRGNSKGSFFGELKPNATVTPSTKDLPETQENPHRGSRGSLAATPQ